MIYPLAKNGIFHTVQGEGALLGQPMVFVRLAGCSIGCKQCDTDYRVSERMDEIGIARRVCELTDNATDMLWITGGEPTDHDLFPLIQELRKTNLEIAIATSGVREIPSRGEWRYGWLSVSPHATHRWQQRVGQELKIVPGLNGLTISDVVSSIDAEGAWFGHYYCQPMFGSEESLRDCLKLISRGGKQRWRMTVQAHKQWGLA